MRINFDFKDLEAFLAIAELGSFQRAAEQLNASQPALTRRIQKLEASLAVTLFERTTRSLRLTLAAKRFRGRAQAMLDDAAETMLALRDETAQWRHQHNAIVTVAVVPSAVQRLLPAAIRAFRQRGRTARVRILDRLANDVAEAVAGGEADFGVGSIPATESNLVFDTVADDRIVLAMRPDHPLAGKRRVSWAQTDPVEFIVPMKGTGNRMLIDEALARTRQTLKWSYEIRRTTTGLALVEAGIGVAALPESAIPAGAGARIVSRPLVTPAVTRTIGIVRRGAHALHPAAEEFCRLLGEVSRASGRSSTRRR